MNLIEKWSANFLDDTEFQELIISRFTSAQLMHRGVKFLRDDEVALELSYNTSGKIKNISRGTALRNSDIDEIERDIKDHLLAKAEPVFHRTVCFFTNPLGGYFRYKQDFQLVEVPPNAPKMPYFLGNHPAFIEIYSPGSSQLRIRTLRFERRIQEIKTSLTLFIPSFINIQLGSGGKDWVYKDIEDGDITSEFRQLGYHYHGLGNLTPDFSDVSAINPMESMNSIDLYERKPGLRIEEPVIIPDNLFNYFERIDSMPEEKRLAFNKACYWFHSAQQIASISASSYYIALVSAIESLLPRSNNKNCETCGKPVGLGPTALFKEFIDRYAPDDQEISRQARKTLYSVRSSLAHGGFILMRDQHHFALDRRFFEQENQSLYLYQIVRLALIRWLEEAHLSK